MQYMLFHTHILLNTCETILNTPYKNGAPLESWYVCVITFHRFVGMYYLSMPQSHRVFTLIMLIKKGSCDVFMFDLTTQP